VPPSATYVLILNERLLLNGNSEANVMRRKGTQLDPLDHRGVMSLAVHDVLVCFSSGVCMPDKSAAAARLPARSVSSKVGRVVEEMWHKMRLGSSYIESDGM